MESWREELYSDSLYHHGIKGMKWGVRRYQNEDGTLTSAGKKRQARSYKNQLNSAEQDIANATASAHDHKQSMDRSKKRLDNIAGRHLEKAKKAKSDEKARATIEKGAIKWEKLKKKYDLQKSLYDADIAKIKRGEQKAKALITEAAKNGLSAESHETWRTTSDMMYLVESRNWKVKPSK